MLKFWKIVKIQIINFWLTGKAKTVKKQLLFLLLGLVILLGGLSILINNILRGEIRPENILFFLSVASLIVMVASFFTTLSNAQTTFFEYKDYDLLATLPINKKAITITKFLSSLVSQWAISIFILLPFLFILMIKLPLSVTFFIYYIIGIFTMPAIPISLGVLLALFFRYITAGTRFENLLRNIVNLLFIIIIFTFSFVINIVKSSTIISKYVSPFLERISFINPGHWFAYGVVNEKIIYIFYLILSAIIAFGICLFLYIISFENIHNRSALGYHVKNFKVTMQKRNSVLLSLLKKEYKFIFSSFAYLINAFLFNIGAIVAMIYLIFFLPTTYFNIIMAEPTHENIALIAIYFISVLFSVANVYSSTCINIEGTRFWIMRTLPISERKLILSKHLVGLSFSFMALLLWTVTVFKFRISLLNALSGYLLSSMIILFNNSFAMNANILLPKMIYDDPAMAMKKGGIGSVIGTIIPYGLGFIMFFMVMSQIKSGNYQLLIMILLSIYSLLALISQAFLWFIGPKRIRKIG